MHRCPMNQSKSQRILGVLILVFGVVAISLAVLATPNLAAQYFSRGHNITPHRIKLLNIGRLILSLGGLAGLIFGFILIAVQDVLEKLQSGLLFLHNHLFTAKMAKWIVGLVLAGLGLIAFPYAVFAQQHIYADGAVFTARLIQTGRMSATGFSNRIMAHLILELPTFFMLKTGLSNIQTLSRIYGFSIYYFPFLCNVLATWLLLRKRMNTQAVLLVSMELILVFFTSYYMDQEAQLASALFVLTLAIIATSNLRWATPLLVLVGLGVLSVAVYEFWAFFFPVCIFYFLLKIKRQIPIHLTGKFLQWLVLFSYVAGTVINVIGAFSPGYATNRGQLLHSLLHEALEWTLVSCLLFGVVILFSCFTPTLIRIFQLEKRLENLGRFQSPGSISVAFLLVLVITAAASVYLNLHNFPRPQDAYSFRTLHLFLPLLWAASFLARNEAASAPVAAPRVALLFVLPILILTMEASLLQTTRWLDYRSSLFTATQHHSGYVPIEQAQLSHSSFLWGWTSPTMSILEQAFHGRDVQSIFYNPTASLQPYAPDDYANAADLAKRLHVKIFLSAP